MTLILSGTDGLSDIDGSAATPAIRGTDANTGIYFPGNDRIGFAEGGVQCGEFDASGNFLMNSGYGSVATAYGCRAWVNFNGTGTVAIRASGNVTSITDNGTGEYTVNITTAMPDANYAVAGEGGGTAGQASIVLADQVVARTTGAFRVYSITTAGSLIDAAQINLAVFR
jgi:hypothetical protein